MVRARTRIHQILGVALVTLTLAFASASIARADIFDCFAALAPLDKAAKAAEVGAAAGACMSTASGDPIMAMTIAALTSAAVGGAFSTVGECNSLIDSIVGQTIAAALLALDLGMSDAQKNLLKQFASGNTPPGLSFKEIVASIPGLQTLPLYIQCGCNVAGAPGEFAKLAEEYARSVEGCGNFFGDAKDAFFEWVGSGMESLFGGHDFVPGVQQETDCYLYEMPANVWTATAITDRPHAGCGSTMCPEGLLIVERKNAAGKREYMCSPTCPEPVKSFQPGGMCYFTDVWMPIAGRCAPGQEQQCCEPGQKVVAGGVCGPACAPDEFFDAKTGDCSPCQENSVPVFTSSGNSIGRCEKCPPGLTSILTGGKCMPCPPGQIMYASDQPASPARRNQPATARQPGSSGYAVRPGAPPPRGPSGVAMSPIPAGQLMSGLAGKCWPCAPNWTPVYQSDPAKSSFGRCEECPPGTYSQHDVVQYFPTGPNGEMRPDPNPGRCRSLNCPGGLDPKRSA